MRSPKADAPKVSLPSRGSEKAETKAPSRSGGIVPPSTRPATAADGFEKPGKSGPSRGKGHSGFEPKRPQRPEVHRPPVSHGPYVGAKTHLSDDVIASLKTAGEDLAVKLGPDADEKTVKDAAWNFVKSLSLANFHLEKEALDLVVNSYRLCASGSGSSKPRPFGTE
ncbi:hypothetical protein [Hyalangium versicolor]|uniref:hypothetical protein n=1 Tax=Hyalangium versicolor TaxID=2861190 RepID=UPI001CC94F97|nr:hypothetical protein [Hyalangium versicolor]